ncbi:Stearoyl-CoA desaturase 5 [Phytophthora citrophthora]|uniref:Stearoyl-CoA desaturase 5 n=1 Tax=Phytophthora citrophthora TaxID=4793 RepID=A0AAD9G4T7_9STRA|nr:Stearoyl-CoA desaturase 5 [Phytophthora citrophthora]
MVATSESSSSSTLHQRRTAAAPASAPAAELIKTQMDGEFAEEEGELFAPEEQAEAGFKWSEVVWYNVVVLAVWHIGALYSLLFVMPHCSLTQLLVLWVLLWIVAGLGITAGAHRLWSHRGYKAKLPLRVFLMLCNSMAFEGTIFEWSRDHRVHHKGSDTTADPHNSERGLFFSHMGWVMVRKHKNVREAGKKLDFSDLLADPVVTFQIKHYLKTVLLMCYLLPTAMGYYLGDAWAGFWVGGIFRHVWVLHMTWMVNSIAHFFGYKPYDRKIQPVENLIVALGALGEGYHNYQYVPALPQSSSSFLANNASFCSHKYPSDYATSEWGLLSGQFNPTKAFIDFMALIGQAYDLKRSRTASRTRERVAKQVAEDRQKRGLSPTMSWWDRQLSQLFFGKSEAQVFQ